MNFNTVKDKHNYFKNLRGVVTLRKVAKFMGLDPDQQEEYYEYDTKVTEEEKAYEASLLGTIDQPTKKVLSFKKST